MGLAQTEFVVAVEKAFDLTIPDGETATLRTPRLLVEYIFRRLKSESPVNWDLADVEAVVEGLLADCAEHTNFTMEMEFRDIFL